MDGEDGPCPPRWLARTTSLGPEEGSGIAQNTTPPVWEFDRSRDALRSAIRGLSLLDH